MHPKTHARWPRVFAGLLLAAGLAGAAANGQPAGQPVPKEFVGDAKVDAKSGSIIVPLKGVVRFDPKIPKDAVLTDILISPEDVLKVRPDPNNPSILILTGARPGLARMSLVLKDKPRLEFEVLVVQDYEAEKAKLKASFIELNKLIQTAFPTASVTATAEFTPDGGGIPIVQGGPGYIVMLRGYVTSPQDGENIVRLVTGMLPGVTAAAGAQAQAQPQGATTTAAATGTSATQNPYIINAIQIGGVQQVQIDVVIASVDRNEIRSRGFDFNVNTRTVQFSSVLSGLLTPPVGAGGIPVFSPDADLQLGLVPAQFFGAMRALRTEGLAKFLAEPRVVTQTGRPAQFRAGGQQAILSPASGINGPGVVLQPFGTELDVLPIVYGNGQIWLEINPRVTAVNQGLGITTVFGATPGFTEQSARCAVMLESGQTFAIGGLIQSSVQASSSRLPVLGDLPFVGTAFSRVNHEERESELVILVTPRLVHAMDCNQVPRRLPGRETRTPDDYELFLEGILEAPRGQRKVWNGRCYNAAYKCDPTLANMPCAGNVCTGPNASGTCNANGCAVPSHTVAAGRPAAFPVPSPVPSAPLTLPVNVPTMPEPPMAPTAPVTLPVTLPPEPELSVPSLPAGLPQAPMAPPAEESPDAPPK